MEFIAKSFAIGSCVSGNIIDGVFIKGTCVNEETVFHVPTSFVPTSFVPTSFVPTSFVPLYKLDVTRGWITQEKYRSEKNNRNPYFKGPTFESNWLFRENSRHGGFAVGGYPDTTSHLLSLFREGLQTFVCLNSEYGKTVKGDYFQPYGIDLPKNQFIHEPIDDMQTVKDETIVELAWKITERLLNGEHVYLHCAGGHGRTGTVALVVLHMLYPELTELELFEFVQYAHDQRAGNYFGERMYTGKMFTDPLAHHIVKSQVPSPQTIDQRDQVRRIIKNLY
jgi:hypothetical protein